MILIIGGAYQGKHDYAVSNYGNKNILDNFHKLVLENIRHGIDTRKYIEENLDSLKDKVIICDDISSGIVPVDEESRAWREETGRSITLLAKHADEVIRIFCGIGSKIK